MPRHGLKFKPAGWRGFYCSEADELIRLRNAFETMIERRGRIEERDILKNMPVSMAGREKRKAKKKILETSSACVDERLAMEHFSFCVIDAAGRDAYATLCDLTMDYIQAAASETHYGLKPNADDQAVPPKMRRGLVEPDGANHNLRETVRAGWLWLFRQAARSNPQVAMDIFTFMQRDDGYQPLLKAAKRVDNKFRIPVPALT